MPTWLQLLHPKVLRGRCIIVERNGGLGDVLCLLPALAALRRQHPDTRLIVITSRSLMLTIQQAHVAHAVLPSGARGLTWLRKKLHSLLDCYVLLPDELATPQPRARVHLMQEFARILGVSNQPLVYPQLSAPPLLVDQRVGAFLKAAGLGHRPLVIIHSGPTWPVKQWPLDSWQRLTSRLKSECGVDVIQAGLDAHPSDPAACAPRVPGAHDWVNQLTLSETSALLKRARLVIGIDSGLLHLANALRIPAVGLFGPTDPVCFMPPDRVEMGMHATLQCIGCHHHAGGPLHWRTGCPHHIQCMSALSVGAVMERCRQVLS